MLIDSSSHISQSIHEALFVKDNLVGAFMWKPHNSILLNVQMLVIWTVFIT